MAHLYVTTAQKPTAVTHAVPCETNPLGVKGCGEAGNGGSYPVIYNAIMDALEAHTWL